MKYLETIKLLRQYWHGNPDEGGVSSWYKTTGQSQRQQTKTIF